MKAQPPKYALKLLRWFCSEAHIEEIEGDLIELFEMQSEVSLPKAKRFFLWRVLMSFRPTLLKSFLNVKISNNLIMYKDHVKVSWRSLKRQPFYSLLNTLGLAIGITGALLIGLFIFEELSFDRSFKDAELIYRVNIDNKTAGEVNKFAAVSGPLAEVMQTDFPHAQLITRFRNTEGKLIRPLNTIQNIKEDHVVGADPMFFNMFGLELLLGDKRTALSEKYSMIMTRTAAEKHFGISEALGQQMVVDNDKTFIVTGIIEDFPKNTFLRDHSILLSISSFDDHQSTGWNNWSFPTFIKLKEPSDVAELDTYLGTVFERYLIPWASQFIPGLTVESAKEQNKQTGNYMHFESIALTDIHLNSPNLSGEFSQNGDRKDVYILGLVGFFLLILASVNFMNLSTAQSLKRAKEVGIRKTLGSKRSSLIDQFLIEALMVTTIAMALAIFTTYQTLPYFNAIAGKYMVVPFDQLNFWIIIFSSTLILGLLSGSYPAFMLSKFSPIKVLKGQFEKGKTGSSLRSFLVVFQFAVSVFLIASTLIVFQQLSFIQNKDLGFSKDQIMVINDIKVAGDQAEVLKQEFKNLAGVDEVSLSSFLPTPSDRNGTTYFPKGKVLQGEAAVIINQWSIDFDYFDLLDLELISGRKFDKQFKTDSSAVILNESVLKMLNVDANEVLGMQITDDFRKESEEEMQFYTVIGVVKNFHYESLKNDVDGLSFIIEAGSDRMMVKLNGGSNFGETIKEISSLWSDLAPGAPFDYYFMDDSFNDVYKSEQQLSNIFMIFTVLSITIACLGLFGLSAYNAERKSKEIGIRKVLGASIKQISFNLSFDFLKLVLISIVISLPFAWLAMNGWLQSFSFRVNLSVWVFILAAVLAILISLLTVGFQSLKAASKNPVDTLKAE